MTGWSPREEYRGCRAGTEMIGWSLREESWVGSCRSDEVGKSELRIEGLAYNDLRQEQHGSTFQKREGS